MYSPLLDIRLVKLVKQVDDKEEVVDTIIEYRRQGRWKESDWAPIEVIKRVIKEDNDRKDNNISSDIQ